MLKNGANVNNDLFLHKAVLNTDYDTNLKTIQLLIDYGANVNAQDSNDETPLYYAIENNHETVVELLLQNNADINIQNEEGNTPLHSAIQYDDTIFEIIEILINHKPNINAVNENGDTSLHLALQYYNTKIVQLLLENISNLRIKNNDNETPIQIAFEQANRSNRLFFIKDIFNWESNITLKDLNKTDLNEIESPLVQNFIHIYFLKNEIWNLWHLNE